MKGKLVPAPMSGNPATAMVNRIYTDANDHDWLLTLGQSGNLVAHPYDDNTATYYARPVDYIAASASNYDAVCDALDAWVDEWNAGQNPQPQIQTDVTSSKPTAGGGAGVLGLIILAILVLTDKKKR